MIMKKKVLNILIGLGLFMSAGYAWYIYTTQDNSREIYIPIISKGSQHQFWQAVKSGAEQAAKDFNVKITFEGPETETMVSKQIDMLSTALSKKPAAIGLAALDSKAATPLLIKAQQKKIPVIAFDSGVDSIIPLTTAATDSVAAASLAADKMATLVGKTGEIAVVAHDKTSRTGIDRRTGFLNRMASNYPNIKVVSVQYGSDQLKAAEVTKDILRNNPFIKGIFGTNEGTAIGILNAVQEVQSKIVIIGYDSGKQQKAAVADGLMAGAITQNPVGMGYKTVEAAVKAIRGEKLPETIDTGFYWWDKSNMNDPGITAVLYD